MEASRNESSRQDQMACMRSPVLHGECQTDCRNLYRIHGIGVEERALSAVELV